MKSWFMAGSHPQDYEQSIDSSITYDGNNSGYLKAKVAQPRGFGTLMQMFKANDYRSKRMRFSAIVRSEGVEDWTGLWMRIDGPQQGEILGFDNMQNRPIKGTTDWQKYAIVLDVPQESIYVAFGLLLHGKGQVWLSDIQFEEVSADVPTTSLEGDRQLPDKPDHHGIIGKIGPSLMDLVAGLLGWSVIHFLFPKITFYSWYILITIIIVAVIFSATQRFIGRQTGRPARAGNLDFAE